MVIKRIKAFLSDPANLPEALPKPYQSADFRLHLDAGLKKLLAQIDGNQATCWNDLLLNFLTRIQIYRDRIDIQMNSETFAQAIFGNKSTSVSDDDDADYNKIRLTISAALKRTGKELRFVVLGAEDYVTPDQSLVLLLQRARALQSAVKHLGSATIEEIASSQNMTPSYATRLTRLNFLAPDIVEAIFAGSPESVSA